MSNKLESWSIPIPKKGIGYKVCYKAYGQYRPIYGDHGLYVVTNDGWIEWDVQLWRDAIGIYNYIDSENRGGFGFFPRKRDAEALFKAYDGVYERRSVVLLKIEYQGGMGRHSNCFEGDMHMDMCLCKRWRVLEELMVG